MTTLDYFLQGWNATPVVLVALLLAALGYARLAGRRGRPTLFIAALVLAAVAFLSPLNLLARGVLFSAHMTQHLLLLLLIPALVLLSWPTLPSTAAPARASDPELASPAPSSSWLGTFTCWTLGVGSMWLWHAPQLCNAAATQPWVHGVQSVSLLAMGAAFWWPILAPRADARLIPGHGIAYLFTACLACTGLGILLTLSPVEVCPVFRAPSTAPAVWSALRDRLTFHRDQQIGGLMMWLPMCLVYVAGIVLELARWFGEPDPALARAAQPKSLSSP